MQRIIIADDCSDASAALVGILRARYQVENCQNGKSALERLRAEKTDLLIADLMLAELDGLELIKTAQQEQLISAVIVTGRVFSEYVLEALEACNVDYAMKKPCSLTSLAERAEELCSRLNEKNASPEEPLCAVSGILLALGFRTKTKGFRYCRDAILMLAEQPGLQMTKNVYPEVGKPWGAKGQAVEKAVRMAITAAWECRDEKVWQMYFSVRPTNTEFLTRIADAVSLGNMTAGGRRA